MSARPHLVHTHHALVRVCSVIFHRSTQRVSAHVPAGVHEGSLELDGGDLGVVGGVDSTETRAQRVLRLPHRALHGLVFRQPEGGHSDVAGTGPGELRAVQARDGAQEAVGAEIPHLAVKNHLSAGSRRIST